MGSASAGAYSWSASLEGWARASFRGAASEVPGTMDFAPRITQRPHTFYDLPVLMLVMTRHTEHLHRAVFHSLELIRESTYGFRAVAVTDSLTDLEHREVDWTVEHIVGESEWLAAREGNWLTYAADHVLWAQGIYGASAVLAPETPEQLAECIVRLGERFRAAEKVISTALQLAEELAEQPAADQRYGLRGWWHELGRSADFTVPADDAAALRVRITRGDLPGVLIGQAGAELSGFLGLADSAGYSTAVLSWEAAGAHDDATGRPGLERSAGAVDAAPDDAAPDGAVREGHREERRAERLQRWLHAAVLACAEELSAAGPSLWLEGGAAAAGTVFALDSAAAASVSAEPLDGTIDLRPAASVESPVAGELGAHDRAGHPGASSAVYRVHMSYGRSLDVRGGHPTIPDVLTRLRQIHLLAQA